MDIKNVVSLKKTLEKVIFDSISEFENRTGLKVESIDLTKVNVTSKFVNTPNYILSEVKATVQL